MANRDLDFTPTVNTVTPALPAAPLELAIASAADKAAEDSAQSKLLLGASQAQVAFKKLDMDFRTKYADDPTNAEGIQALSESRQQVVDSLGESVPSFAMRSWSTKTTELATASQVGNEAWAYKQQKTNTVKNVNSSIALQLQQANQTGIELGQSDVMDVNALTGYLGARSNIEQFGSAVLGGEQTQTMLKNFNKDYVKSLIAGVAESNPARAAGLLETPELKENFTTEERGEMADLIQRTQKQQGLVKSLQVTVSDSGLTDLVNDPNKTYFEKRASIDQLDMAGSITPSAAAKARRVIRSSDDLNTTTDTPTMSDIINRVYDLNANAASNPDDYLRGVRAINEDVLDKQAAGQLTAQDAGKLSKQISTLTNKKVSDATASVGGEFYEANQQFNALPPEYRGEATRQLFTIGDGKAFTKQQYSSAANTIIDQINTRRRKQALQITTDAAKGDAAFLKGMGASQQSVTDTARKYGISEQEVVRRLRAHQIHKNSGSVPRALGRDAEPADSGEGDYLPATPAEPPAAFPADESDTSDE